MTLSIQGTTFRRHWVLLLSITIRVLYLLYTGSVVLDPKFQLPSLFPFQLIRAGNVVKMALQVTALPDYVYHSND